MVKYIVEVGTANVWFGFVKLGEFQQNENRLINGHEKTCGFVPKSQDYVCFPFFRWPTLLKVRVGGGMINF